MGKGKLTQQGSCEQIQCTAITFPNAIGLPDSINATEEHPVTCNSGFKPTKGAMLKCNAKGKLTQQGSCEQIQCTAITFPNAIGLPDSINATEEHPVTCNSGFKP